MSVIGMIGLAAVAAVIYFAGQMAWIHRDR